MMEIDKTQKYARGSEWRKWDLHVHTPASILNNQFGNDWDEYVRNLFNKAIKYNIVVIGITDYFSIDGYKKIKTEYLNDEKLCELFKNEIQQDSNYLKKIKAITLLPNIELRLDTVVSYKNSQENKRLQLHLIFDDTVSISDIEENCLDKLCIHGASSTQNGTDCVKLSKNNIESLGRRTKEIQKEFERYSDYEAGCNCALVQYHSLNEFKKETQNLFEGRYIVVLPEDDITKINWNDQGREIRNILYSISDGIFSSNPRTIKWGLEDSTKNEFSSYMPCFWGSDAHCFEKLFLPDLERYCWIKADPSFDGIKQVLFNPKDRIHIGKEPNKIEEIRKNKHQYIDKISVKKIDEPVSKNKWFDFELELNPNLVAVIGSKGSGKSAFSDIVGHLCECNNMKDASFLNDDRFRKKTTKYAGDYDGTINWLDDHKFSLNLMEDSYNSTIEKAQYLPQKFIEKTCNDLNDSKFQEEIDKVIFSYVDEKDKLNTINLSELIGKKTKGIKEESQKYRNSLEFLNEEIIKLENKQSSEYKKHIKDGLKEANELLQRHENNKPKEIKKPENNENNKEIQELIEINKQLEKVQENIKFNQEKYTKYTNKKEEIIELEKEIDLLEEKTKELNKKLQLYASENSIKDSSIKFNKNIENLTVYKNNINQELTKIDELLDTSEDAPKNALYKIENFLKIEKETLISKTNTEERTYQKYLIELKEWDDNKNKLIGDVNLENSIKFYENEQKYLENKLIVDLKAKKQERKELIIKLYDIYIKQVSIYNEIYEPIDKKLKSILKNIEDKIEFSVDIVLKEKNFISLLLSHINQTVKSPFKGQSEGYEKMSSLIKETNFSHQDNVLNLINGILNSISEEADNIEKVFNKNKRFEFYNYLTSLKFLNVEYTLEMGGRSLKELSPGERGILLLIFYLALSKEDKPIIIDQPEDNLDNESVYSKLVPCILEAKKRRQVIVVTHNPNIAVACDAEQIIFCKIDKFENKIDYKSGSIENQKIRDKVVDILEGTRPAFDLRKQKYDN